MMQSAPIAEFRIAPELRRCCYYVIIAAIVFAGLIYYVMRIDGGRPIEDLITGWVMFGGIACASMLPLRWRLRIDGQGLQRLRLFRWDLWSWDDMASGRLKKRFPYKLVDPARPLWRRTLNLEYLGGENTQIVFKAINAHYRLPEPPELPERLKIKYGFRRTAILDEDGVHLRIKGLEKAYPWREVQNVFIVRLDSERRDFRSMHIILPDEEIELKFAGSQQGTVCWREASSEEISEYLCRHVLTEKISVAISGEAIANRAHLERTLKEAEKQARETRLLLYFISVSIPCTVIAMWIGQGPYFALAMGTAICVQILPIAIKLYWRNRARVKELEGQLQLPAIGNVHLGNDTTA